jgi:DNA-binding NtrC family response regulator
MHSEAATQVESQNQTVAVQSPAASSLSPRRSSKDAEVDRPSLLEIGRRAAMQAEREAIERVLYETRWNRRQAAKILKISYKALLNKLKLIEAQNADSKQH